MAIIENYIKLIKLDQKAPGEVYLEISKKLDWYAENAEPADEQYEELRSAYNFFAHMLAHIYLEDHGLT